MEFSLVVHNDDIAGGPWGHTDKIKPLVLKICTNIRVILIRMMSAVL